MLTKTFFEQVYDIVKHIPYGTVVSYGQIARILGRPRSAREVGYAMRRCPENLPWHRVVTANGEISGGEYAPLRRALLVDENIPFLADGRVDIKTCAATDGELKKDSAYRAFAPLCGDDPKILILGTFPSPLSREAGEYYGNVRNQFWRLIFGVFDEPFDNPSYDVKKAVLFANGVALWDCISECEIQGALDSNLRKNCGCGEAR